MLADETRQARLIVIARLEDRETMVDGNTADEIIMGGFVRSIPSRDADRVEKCENQVGQKDEPETDRNSATCDQPDVTSREAVRGSLYHPRRSLIRTLITSAIIRKESRTESTLLPGA